MPASPQSTATLMVDKTTAAITAPVTAAAFAAANNLAEAGAPEAHASTHADGGADEVTLAQSQITNLTTDLAAKQPLATVLTNTTAAFTTAQETKLAGVATGATANSSDATLLARANHTGTQSADTLTDGTTNKAFLATERTKLAGIATAATANSSDATLLARANHTGTQAQSTVTNLETDLAGKQPLATVLTNTTAAFTTAQETKLSGIETGAQANVALASQAEAEAGVETTKTMTPVRVAQAIAALAAPGGVTSVDGATGAVDTGYDDRITALENIEPTASGSNLVSGGGVSLTGGLTLTVSAAIYNILGAAKESVETILTAATADPTNPRYDVVALDDTGTAVLITGTPAATPVVPTVDPATQFYVTQISIPAGATSITGTETIVYDSNDDYTMTEQGTSIVLNSTNNPRGGSGVCIEATTMVATDYVQAQTASGTIDLGTFNVLRFFIRNKAAWHASKQIAITARLNGVQVGQAVVFKHGLHAFDQSNVTTYQHIALNPNLFAAGGQPINQLRWTCAGGGSAITGFYVDDISLQAGVAQVTDSTRLRDTVEHSTARQYDVNDLAFSGAIIYKALQQTPVGIAVTNTTYWAVFGMRNPMTTAGDLIIGGASGVPDRLAADSTAGHVLTSNGTGVAPSYQAAAGGGGSNTLERWTALDAQQPAATYATLNTRNSIAILEFDDTTSESAIFVGIVPEGADFTPGVTVRIIWAAAPATTTGNVIWTTAFERGNTDLDSDSFATGVDSAASAANGTNGIVTVASINHTSSEIDGIVAGDLFRLRVSRNAASGSDTMSLDAHVIAVELRLQ